MELGGFVREKVQASGVRYWVMGDLVIGDLVMGDGVIGDGVIGPKHIL